MSQQARERNENKFFRIDFHLPSRPMSEDGFIKLMEDEIHDAYMKGASNIVIEYCFCDGSGGCNGQCSGHYSVLKPAMEAIISDFKEKEGSEAVNFEDLATRTEYSGRKRDEERFVLDKEDNYFSQGLVDRISKKMNSTREDAISLLRAFLYNSLLTREEGAPDEDSEVLEKAKSHIGMDIDLEVLSHLLLKKFVDGKINIKEFIGRLKNIDSEVAEAVINRLRQSEKELV